MRYRTGMRVVAMVLGCMAAIPGVASAGALEAVNGARQAAGLSALSASPQLQQAAQAHAEYLSRYLPQGGIVTVSAHQQRRSLPGFSGELAPDRAAYFKYPHSLVTENISVGNRSVEESVSSLMSAIYHRFAFLDPQIDQLGFAEVDQRYVYNMGQGELAQACLSQPAEARVQPPHNCLGKRMRASAYDQLCTQIPAEAVYTEPFSSRCANGVLLREDFMQQVCATPPAGAELRGAGRYYNACGNGLKIAAAWFDRICRSNDPNIIYTHSGSFYELCEPARKVHAAWYEAMCANLPPEAQETDSGRYYRVCNNDFEIKSEYLERLHSEALDGVSEAVLWPADGVTDIQPVFYDEDPHPTPDLPMTGYPITVEFNPDKVKQVSIMGFTLEVADSEAMGGWRAVEPVRQLDQLNDLNALLSEYQFAWFPIERLEWGAHYRYRIDALVDGVFRQYSAGFDTTALPVPLYQVNAESGQVTVNDNHFILYRPPDAYDNTPFKQVGLRYRGRPYVEVSVIDTNTVELKAGGSGCAPVFLTTRLEEQLQINFCARRQGRRLF